MNTDSLNKPDPMADKKYAIRHILIDFHSMFNSYWQDYLDGAITEEEWTVIRENLFVKATENVEALFAKALNHRKDEDET